MDKSRAFELIDRIERGGVTGELANWQNELNQMTAALGKTIRRNYTMSIDDCLKLRLPGDDYFWSIKTPAKVLYFESASVDIVKLSHGIMASGSSGQLTIAMLKAYWSLK